MWHRNILELHNIVSNVIRRCDSALSDITQRLKLLNRHDALTILSISLGHPRAVYNLRSAPCFEDTSFLKELDDALRDAVVSSCCVAMDDKCWDRDTLPPTSGGVGIRSAADLAVPQFLASLSATRPQADLLCGEAPDIARDAAEARWRETNGADLPREGATRLDTWTEPPAKAKRERVASSVTSRSNIARFLSASTPESAILWTGIPNSRIGTRLSDNALTIAMGLRLGLSVATPGVCRCGRVLNALGDHALSCNKGVGRSARHTEVNARIGSFLSEAGCPSVLEPAGLVRSDGKRPDGVTVLPFE